MEKIDVAALERRTPMPASDDRAQPKSDPPGPADRIIKRIQEAQELRAFEETYGLRERRGGERPAENGGDAKDVALQMIRSQSEFITGLLSGMQKMQAGDNGQNNQFVQYLTGELKDLKTRLDNGGPDPITVAVEAVQKLKQLQGETADRAGVPPGTDFHAVIELEKVRGERELAIERMRQESTERQNQFQLQLLQFQHQLDMERESAKAAAAERQEDGRRRGEAFAMVQDLGMSVINSIDSDRGVEERPVAMKARQRKTEQEEKVLIPLSFTCEQCGATVHNPDRLMTIECPECGTSYGMEEQTAGD